MIHTADERYFQAGLASFIDLTEKHQSTLNKINSRIEIYDQADLALCQSSSFKETKMSMPSNVGFIPSRWELLSHIVDYVGDILCEYDFNLQQAHKSNPDHLVFKILASIEEAAKQKDKERFNVLFKHLFYQNFKNIEKHQYNISSREAEDKWRCNSIAYSYQKALSNKILPDDQISAHLISQPIEAFKSCATLQAHCLCLYEISKFNHLIGYFWNEKTIKLLTHAVNLGEWNITVLCCAVINNISTSKHKNEPLAQPCLHVVNKLYEFHPNKNIKAWASYFLQRHYNLQNKA